MMAPTPSLVRDFWSFMTERFETRVVDKRSARSMKLFGGLLAKLVSMDRDVFLLHRATTIGGTIYLPFQPGDDRSDWGLWEQMLLCVVEHDRVLQGEELGVIGYGLRRLTSLGRALLEAEACRCRLEMEWWRTGRVPDPVAIADRLRGDGVVDAHIALVAISLRRAAERIRAGVIHSRASAVAIEWLDTFAPHLRAATT